ncbi:hypothetical protein ABFX02_01G028400 [Erythranthe guttata]
MKTLVNNQTNFKIELVAESEKLSGMTWARQTVPPKKSMLVEHSFIRRCGDVHGSSNWEFCVLLNGDKRETTIKSTDVTYCLRIAFDHARDQKHLLLVQGVEEKPKSLSDFLLRIWLSNVNSSGLSRINKVLDKRPAYDIPQVALPRELRVNGDGRPLVLVNASTVVTTEDYLLEAPRDTEDEYHLTPQILVPVADAIALSVIEDVDSVRFLVLPVAVADAASLSGEEQKLDHGSQIPAPENGGRIKSIIDQFSASVKQWRSYRLNSVQKLNGYHIMLLMMIAALFGYYVGLSGVTLDQIHLIIYNRIKVVMYKLMMYVVTNVFHHLKDTEFCNV